MAFNGNGVFVRLYNWVNDAAANIKIRADRMDNEMDGFATGLSTCITKDGQTTITSNLPMAGFRHTGVGNAAARNDYAAFGQVQDGKAAWADAGGTADAITAAYSIPVTALVDGQLCYVRALAANATTTPTFSPNGLTARTIVKNGGQALAAGDIAGDGHELELRYDLSNTRWELMNPKSSAAPYTPASSSGPASLPFAEDTDNGNNTVTVQAPASLSGNVTATLPSYTATLVGTLDIKGQADGRLTLTTGVPVTTSDVTGATTVYYTPYIGNQIGLYTGSAWVSYTFSELSLALGTLTSGLPYDVFLDYNGGTPQLAMTAWTNDTTRATALTTQDGVYVKNGDTEQRYLGTFYTTSTTTTEDSLAQRYLWNMYNRINRPMKVVDATASWNYTTLTWRQARATTTNELRFVRGLNEDEVHATLTQNVSNTNAGVGVYGAIGLDSTTTPATDSTILSATVPTAGGRQSIINNYHGFPGLGRHRLVWLEQSIATGTTTWDGENSGVPNRSVINGGILA